ncbi:hypothetical protein Golax_008549 [Gossypium laxum]|uniref:Protein kinase domain-containing protein n=1 Tax=Gossypium laxum TaxID=34288 RepID=A0A7J9AA72_9ROSI|nr:hypothetical protein [Gossypium laxum]
MEDVRSTYVFDRELNYVSLVLPTWYKLINHDDIEDVCCEVQIMYHLTGHRDIVELKAIYEDRHSVNLIMELCVRGELFDRIIAKGHYSEKEAANLCRQIVTVGIIVIQWGVMHKDLKPENFLFLNPKRT